MDDWEDDIERLKWLHQQNIDALDKMFKYLKHVEHKVDTLYALVKSIDERERIEDDK